MPAWVPEFVTPQLITSVVVIFMVMGRQLGENPGSQTAGAIVTWGGLLALLLADVLLVRLGVRR